ncbi:SDR family oxidoreductase [Saccharopolyspora sp. K220]|uniref:SDR family NAD(P)-dependent oxidoreductase n=1 Tax=Saccharopolyspora soli TaxID=2926618 RepID=UPI001F59369C|nr:SDR family NAD(P)-dependent oxidoreductase [Saccharopolyspora soli]MCI2419542.1 SDR family oxidoreductase [Saccharopolyspora soli]
MSDLRLSGKVAMVVGAGQTPGRTIGNGRATAILFAREGARVVAVDRDLDAAQATVDQIGAEGGEAFAVQADVTSETDITAMIAACVDRWNRLDILHNNAGISIAGGDAPISEIDAAAFDRVTAVNLQSMVISCKHALAVMRRQGSGAIVNISSLAAVINYPFVAYRTSKAGVITMTQHIAITNARYGIRANVILPGLIDTPMAIENRVGRGGATREEVIAERNSHVPLGNKMGTGWDVARAALFLASEEASFITGATLTVDGGQSLVTG